MKEVKYADQKWADGTPVAGEQLSVNGHYVGEHLGTPMQDAANPDISTDPHWVARNTVRHSPMTQDAAVNANMPETAGGGK